MGTCTGKALKLLFWQSESGVGMISMSLAPGVRRWPTQVRSYWKNLLMRYLGIRHDPILSVRCPGAVCRAEARVNNNRSGAKMKVLRAQSLNALLM